LIWSLRYHSRDGGFYIHFEPATNTQAYHVPGFANGFDAQEELIVDATRLYGLRISGMNPLTPQIIPGTPSSTTGYILTPRLIRFRGSAGAHSYRIWRKLAQETTYTVISQFFYDNKNTGTSVFSDFTAVANVRYNYGIEARNKDQVSNGRILVLGPLQL
jgi:hypothetical protein